MHYQQSYNPRRPFYVCQANGVTWIGKHPKSTIIRRWKLVSAHIHKWARTMCTKMNNEEQEKG